MAGEWLEATLEDVCAVITDGAHFSPKDDPRGLPMASVKDLTRHGILLQGCRRISQADFELLRRQGCSPQYGDVLIAKDGNSALDTVCVHQLSEEVVLLSSVAILRPNGRVKSGFLRYYLDAPETRALLKSGFRSGSAIPRVVLKDFRRAPVVVPPIDEQRAIAHILGTLDDKIELNRQMAETLEAMARALFKSWFVDFDPVRAKAEGRDPGLPKPLADLFPTRLVDSELGEIPEGWRYLPLGEFVELTRGTTYSGNLKELPGPVLLGLASIARNGGFREDKLSTYGGDSPAKLLLGPGELFASLKDVTQSADLLGAVARVPSHVKQGRLTQDTVRLAFKSATTSRQIVYRTLLTPTYREYCRSHATGTTNLGLRREDFLAYPVVKPSAAVQRAFDVVMEEIEARASSAVAESRTLAALRDALLPKLISGELRVRSTEELLQAVV